MQIVIPMAGFGQRFLDANYTEPKPLVTVGCRPMIEHVINTFPGVADTDFLFICNETHLQSSKLESLLRSMKPNCQIQSIPPNKFGPVYTTLQACDKIRDNDEIILQYCDVSQYWNFSEFLNFVHTDGSDGCLLAYKGFHPNMLGTTLYAAIKDDGYQWAKEVKEKSSYSQNKMADYNSSGTHWFRSGSMMKHYFQKLIDRNINFNGEYFTSLVFNLLKEDGLKISIYEIQHMLQFGTPYDVDCFNKWYDYFEEISCNPILSKGYLPNTHLVMPMAGAGKRFSDLYTVPKPMIPVSGYPMFTQAVNHAPLMVKKTFIVQNNHIRINNIDQQIEKYFLGTNITTTNGLTRGQACTAYEAIKYLDLEQKIMILACDSGFVYDDRFIETLKNQEVDCAVVCVKNEPMSVYNPNAYSWIETDDGETVSRVSLKQPVSQQPYKDYALTGHFMFRNREVFTTAYNELIKNKDVKEYYIDSLVNCCIQQGRRVVLAPVKHFICWGTPEELSTYTYWQSLFHKYNLCGYNIKNDPYVNKDDSYIRKLEHEIWKPKRNNHIGVPT